MDDDGFEACTTYRDFVTNFFPQKMRTGEWESGGKKILSS